VGSRTDSGLPVEAGRGSLPEMEAEISGRLTVVAQKGSRLELRSMTGSGLAVKARTRTAETGRGPEVGSTTSRDRRRT
jgi:hypothetical protein